MNSPKAVANFFLDRAFDEDVEVSPMKLQKLLYYAQGWHLGFTGEPIFNEQIECWQYGPVVSSIFHHFKDFGSDPIDRHALARRIRRTDGFSTATMYPSLPSPLEEDSEEILDAVWESYKKFSAIKLSNMTHADDSPWSTIMKKYKGQPLKGTDIPMPLMRRYFKAQLRDNE